MSDNPLVVESSTPNPSSRWNRYSQIKLENIAVRRAQSSEEFATVARLREQGFGRFADGDAPRNWVDSSDRADGIFSLLAITSSGEAIATMRVQDSRRSTLELASRVPNESILSPHLPAAQFARLSVTKHIEGYDAMFALFKAAWRWCFVSKLQSILIASPPWARPIYDFMCFDELGPDGRFSHELAGGAEHVSMMLDVQNAESIWRSRGQPLCTSFFDVDHPNICATERTKL